MTPDELVILLPLAALVLWLTLFLFTLVDHFIYRGTYGHFLLGLEAIVREAGASAAGRTALAAHMRQAKTRYLARYLSLAAASPDSARAASEEYVRRLGAGLLLARAAQARPRRRAQQVAALYALSRTRHPEVLPLLDRALGSAQPVVAYAALDMLDIHGSQGAAEVLLRALEEGVLPASRIATHLEHFRIDLAPLYVARLERTAPESPYWLAYLLGKTHYSERADAILSRLLSDPAADVRKVALSSLAALQAPELQAHAERMLGDPVFFVRTQAARILAGIPNPQSVRALAGHLADAHDAVQLTVKRSLVELGPVSLEHLPAATRDKDDAVRAVVSQITSTIRHAQGEHAPSPAVAARVEAPQGG